MKPTLFLLCAVLFLAPLHAGAALGGDVDSVATDRAQLRASTARITKAQNFEVHEFRAATGTTIREYVSSAGQVFGVTWHGPANPDLRQILGARYDQFLHAARAHPEVRRGPFIIQEPGLVVQMSGTMRAHSGRAYIPELLPAPVQAEMIR
jgi:Protein of unknown function (DUF2844)